MSLTEGNHTVTIVEHGLSLDAKKQPTVFVQFSNGAKWQGWLTEKAQEWTAKNLVTLGFKGNELKELNYPGAIDPTHRVEIVIKNESWVNETGETKTKLKVQYINKVAQKLSDKEAATVLGGMDLKGLFASERQEQGVKHVKTEKVNVLQSPNISTEEIPF